MAEGVDHSQHRLGGLLPDPNAQALSATELQQRVSELKDDLTQTWLDQLEGTHRNLRG
jgi:hypothetical protein